MKFYIKDIEKIAQNLVKYLESNITDNATVLALHGNLGAGKTTLTQNIAKVFNIKNVVNSPTFVIQKKYEIEKGPYKNLIHIDAYRINNGDVGVLEIKKELKKKRNLIIIEWPGNIKEIIPDHTYNIYLDHTDDEKVREIRIEKDGADITTTI